MNLNPAELLKLLNPVFNTLDGLIENDGVYLYLVFVWLSSGAIAWVLVGGLRRRRTQGNSSPVIPGIIITTRPPMHQPPPTVIAEFDPTQNHDNEIMD